MSESVITAHRGFAGIAPENTVGAVVGAATTGVDWVEIDVRPAACGTPVVFHDDRLDGRRNGRPITDVAGLVRETELDTVTSATVLDSGESVPTLATLINAVPKSVGVNVELKGCGVPTDRYGESLPERDRARARDRWLPFVERVVAEVDRFRGPLRFSSFFEGAIAALADVAPDADTAPLVFDDLAGGLDIARRYDCEAIHPPRNAIAGTPLAKTGYHDLPATLAEQVNVLDVAHAEGREVHVWTVETWNQFVQLTAAGVDGIITDYPGLDGRLAEIGSQRSEVSPLSN